MPRKERAVKMGAGTAGVSVLLSRVALSLALLTVAQLFSLSESFAPSACLFSPCESLVPSSQSFPPATLLVQAASCEEQSSARQVSQKQPAQYAQYRLNDLSFLQGTWGGTNESGAYVEEYWSKPQENRKQSAIVVIIKAGKPPFTNCWQSLAKSTESLLR